MATNETKEYLEKVEASLRMAPRRKNPAEAQTMKLLATTVRSHRMTGEPLLALTLTIPTGQRHSVKPGSADIVVRILKQADNNVRILKQAFSLTECLCPTGTHQEEPYAA